MRMLPVRLAGLLLFATACLHPPASVSADAPSFEALGPDAFAAELEDYATKSPNESIAIAEDALTRLEPGSRRIRASILLSMGSAYRLQGDYPKASELAAEAARLVESLDAPRELGRSHNLDGIVLWRLGDLTGARAQFERAREIYRSAGLEDKATDATINLALIHYTEGKTATALSMSLEALAVKRLAGDDIAISVLLNNIGAMYRRQGDYEKAIESYFETLQISEAMDDEAGLFAPLYNIGVTYQRWEQYETALQYYRRAMTAAEAQELERSIARAKAAIGETLMMSGDPTAAEPYLVEAAATFETLGNRPHLGIVLVNLSRLYRRTDRLALSREPLVRAEAIFTEAGIDPSLASVLEKRARTEMADGNTALAFDYLARAGVVVARNDDAELELDLLEAYVDLHEENGEPQRALDTLRRRVELERVVLNDRTRTRLAEMDGLYQATEARRALEEAEHQRAIAEVELQRQRARSRAVIVASIGVLALTIIAATLFVTRRHLRLSNQHREELQSVVAARTAELEESNQDLRATIGDLHSTREQLIEAEKMAAIASLVAGVAHKINTPLGNAITAASLLERDGTNTRAQGIVTDSLQRIVDLVSAFREVATDRALEKRQRFDIGSYVESVVQTLAAGEESGLTVHLDTEPLEIDSYPRVFLQVIGNLYLNTVRHAYPAGAEGNLWISISSAGESVRLVYRDEGCGMDEETLARVFEPFFARDHAQGSHGLGMHIVYNLVTQVLDGRISCESQRDFGVRFELEFPRVSPVSRELSAVAV
ncbi:MAG: tetratricopeptide repeat-containing sensor histidine kinase [Pseudomonadota bacterium]